MCHASTNLGHPGRDDRVALHPLVTWARVLVVNPMLVHAELCTLEVYCVCFTVATVDYIQVYFQESPQVWRYVC